MKLSMAMLPVFSSMLTNVQCDVNRDIEINDKLQLTLPDIQLKDADRVFRLYIKSLQDKAVYRTEESLTLNKILPNAVKNIINPYKSVENKLASMLSEQFKQFMESIPKCYCDQHWHSLRNTTSSRRCC